MSPDPFRRLDHIDPPGQWDEIARRVAASGDDLDVELDRATRPHRRGAVLLVAAAAVVALLAGGVVATTRDDHDGVATSPGPAEPGSDMDGPCPFSLDPGPPEQVVTPGRGPVEVPAALVELAVDDPDLDLGPWTRGSWGRTTFDGTEMSITVYADGGTTLTPLGPFTDARLVDDARGKELGITGISVLEGSPRCRTVQVQLRAGLTEADAVVLGEAEAAGDDPLEVLDLDPYIEEYDDLVNRALGAVRLADPGPGPAAEPCAELVDPEADLVAPTVESEPPLPYSFAGETADGRAFTVDVRTEPEGDMAFVEVAGDPDSGGGGSLPDGPGDQGWSWTGDDAGIVVGWRPADAVATAALRPDGTLATEGLVHSPGGTLFALPDVGRSLGPDGETTTWPIVHCRADGTPIDVDREAALEQQEDDLQDQIDEEGDEFRERMAACAEQPEACPPDETGTTPPPDGGGARPGDR